MWANFAIKVQILVGNKTDQHNPLLISLVYFLWKQVSYYSVVKAP